jgi:hypothetical protein
MRKLLFQNGLSHHDPSMESTNMPISTAEVGTLIFIAVYLWDPTSASGDVEPVHCETADMV